MVVSRKENNGRLRARREGSEKRRVIIQIEKVNRANSVTSFADKRTVYCQLCNVRVPDPF